MKVDRTAMVRAGGTQAAGKEPGLMATDKDPLAKLEASMGRLGDRALLAALWSLSDEDIVILAHMGIILASHLEELDWPEQIKKRAVQLVGMLIGAGAARGTQV